MNTTPSPHTATPLNQAVSERNRPRLDATDRMGADGERALVLGGGGSTGNAWLIGVIAGLFDAGLDVTAADRTVGTSAGSTAAAQIAGATPTELYAATVAAVPPPRTGAASPRRSPAAGHMDRTRRIVEDSADIVDMRRRLGAAALDLDATSDGSWTTRWRDIVAARLPDQRWPQRSVLITAVDAQSGDPVVFDRDSGIDLVDAVAASCSSGLPYRIGDHLFIDGGYRINAENADLADGFARVLVLSPFGGRTRTPADWGLDLAAQVADLRTHGSRVETICPTDDAEHLFGANAMDYSLRPTAARVGHDQGRALAGSLADFWT
ncbi:patatin-like phospholipase family protein [Gordonia sp. CPCC 206044]|uniref:patatin-like phospholipase family protein n=1 Tax=Gordonia sp. CPCC 206044 TaxID=3140793 RepID=UPI003AF39914